MFLAWKHGLCHGPRLAVDSEHVVECIDTVNEPPGFGLFKTGRDGLGDFEEADPAIEKCRHRYLVGGVENCGGCTAPVQRLRGDTKRRETVVIGRFEREALERDEIQP